jgi:hypothetical protein
LRFCESPFGPLIHRISIWDTWLPRDDLFEDYYEPDAVYVLHRINPVVKGKLLHRCINVLEWWDVPTSNPVLLLEQNGCADLRQLCDVAAGVAPSLLVLETRGRSLSCGFSRVPWPDDDEKVPVADGDSFFASVNSGRKFQEFGPRDIQSRTGFGFGSGPWMCFWIGESGELGTHPAGDFDRAGQKMILGSGSHCDGTNTWASVARLEFWQL